MQKLEETEPPPQKKTVTMGKESTETQTQSEIQSYGITAQQMLNLEGGQFNLLLCSPVLYVKIVLLYMYIYCVFIVVTVLCHPLGQVTLKKDFFNLNELFELVK